MLQRSAAAHVSKGVDSVERSPRRIPAISRLLMTWVAVLAIPSCSTAHELVLTDRASKPASSRPRAVLGCTTDFMFKQVRRQGWGGRAVLSTSVPPDSPVVDVRNHDPDVLTLVDSDPWRITARGRQLGHATMSAVWAEQALSFDVEVVPIGSVELTHPIDGLLSEEGSAVFLSGSSVSFEVGLWAPDGARLFADCDRTALPVDVEGAATVQTFEGDVLTLELEAPGRVAVRVGEFERVLQVVAPSDVTELELVVPRFLQEHLDPELDDPRATLGHATTSSSRVATVRATTREGRVVVGVRDVQSETPTQCSVARSPAPNTRDIRGLGPPGRGFDPRTWDVRGLAPGECRVQARVGDLEATRALRVR